MKIGIEKSSLYLSIILSIFTEVFGRAKLRHHTLPRWKNIYFNIHTMPFWDLRKKLNFIAFNSI